MNKIDIDFQEKCSKFVHAQVYVSMSYWVDFYQKQTECWFDDPDLHNFVLHDEENRIEGDDNYNEDDANFPEVFEWWAVSSFLYEKLKAKGEVVWDHPLGLRLWGRCTTGQAILLDYVIEAIVKDLEAYK